jgi:hypothetical protein
LVSEVVKFPKDSPSHDSIVDAIETLARVFHEKLAGLNVEPTKRGYTKEEAAQYLGCSTAKIDQLVAEGKLHPTYYMRWPIFDILELKKLFGS